MAEVDTGILDNYSEGKVGYFLSKHILPGSDLAFVSAFFTIYAYQRLKAALDEISSLRFLLGEPRFLHEISPDGAESKSFGIVDEGLALENYLEQKAVARECSDWIRQKAEIRSMMRSNFLHGKMYHIAKPNGTEEAVLGSSNFTVNGLGIGDNPNMELNIVLNDRRDVASLRSWFERVWNDDELSEDVKEKILKYLGMLYGDKSPEFIYYKTLFHIFQEYLSDQMRGGLLDEKTGFFETNIWGMLYDFQKDGVKGVINKIQRFGGCILADSVGLGKTFEALAVMKYYELLNARVLVLCPKKLRANWTLYLMNDTRNILEKDRFSYNVLSHTDLGRKTGKVGDIELSNHIWGNYDLVVIDESHNFRNARYGGISPKGESLKTRYECLMEDVIKKGRGTKVLLLSATPVNNNLKDLRNQFHLITHGKDDAYAESLEVRNISQTMRNAQTHFTNWADQKKNPGRRLSDLMNSLGSDFFRLLDSLTISRSRVHIKGHYDLARIGKFPERLKPVSVYSRIDTDNHFPSYDKIEEEIRKYQLSIFNPSKYIKEEFLASYEDKLKGIRNITALQTQKEREHYLIGMMKVNFLKRLESSIQSFEISMERTIEKIDRLIDKIRSFDENYDEYTQPSLIGKDMETLDPSDNDGLQEMLEVGSKLKFPLAHLKTEDWQKDLNRDRDQILSLLNNAQSVSVQRDAKLAKLKEIIREKALNPSNGGNRKILVFTAFSDTAKYLYNSLQPWISEELKIHSALITGTGDNQTTFKFREFKAQADFESIITNFSPISKRRDLMPNMPQDGEIDILIATDCISEGQNLQDCDCVVNYDIHWNPVRIIQRFGRIDRIGSRNASIKMINFWPTEDLNKYINLKARVEARMALVNLTSTGEDDLLNQEQLRDLINEEELTFRQKQLMKLKDEILDLEEMEDNVSLSEFTLDDFRVELMQYLETNRKELENAPFGLYSVVPAVPDRQIDLFERNLSEIVRPGIIFCLKHRNGGEAASEVNPLNPYYLVYVRDDGDVRYGYTSVKQILRIFQMLCSGQKEPIAELCELFNNETENGKDMSKQTGLLNKAVNDIVRRFEKRNLGNLFSGRDGKILASNVKIKGSNDFELVTWLVIK